MPSTRASISSTQPKCIRRRRSARRLKAAPRNISAPGSKRPASAGISCSPPRSPAPAATICAAARAPDAVNIRAAIDSSLKRLKTDYIDLYQVHWPNRGHFHFRQNWRYNPFTQDREKAIANIAEILETMGELVKAGKIRAIGLSNETTWGIQKYLTIAEQKGLPRVVSTQNEYNLLYRHFDLDLAELSHHEDVGLLAYSPLAGGILSGKYVGGARPAGSRGSINTDIGGRLQPLQEPPVKAYLEICSQVSTGPGKARARLLPDQALHDLRHHRRDLDGPARNRHRFGLCHVAGRSDCRDRKGTPAVSSADVTSNESALPPRQGARTVGCLCLSNPLCEGSSQK